MLSATKLIADLFTNQSTKPGFSNSGQRSTSFQEGCETFQNVTILRHFAETFLENYRIFYWSNQEISWYLISKLKFSINGVNYMCCVYFDSFSYFNFIVVLAQYLIVGPTKIFNKCGPPPKKDWEANVLNVLIYCMKYILKMPLLRSTYRLESSWAKTYMRMLKQLKETFRFIANNFPTAFYQNKSGFFYAQLRWPLELQGLEQCTKDDIATERLKCQVTVNYFLLCWT